MQKCKISDLSNEKSSGMDGDDGCLTMWMYWTVHFQKVKMVNFMLCVFYHKKKKATNLEGISVTAVNRKMLLTIIFQIFWLTEKIIAAYPSTKRQYDRNEMV